MSDASLDRYIASGLEKAKPKYWTITANFFIALLVSFLAAITVLGLLVVPAIWGGYYESLIRVSKGEAVEVGDFFNKGFRGGNWWKLLLLYLLAILGILIGFILLIIPGVYLSVVWGLSAYFLVDQNLPVIDSLRKSRELVRHIGWWKMFAVFWGLGLVLAVLGAIPLIGIVFTIGLYPVVLMISVNIYDSTAREPEKSGMLRKS